MEISLTIVPAKSAAAALRRFLARPWWRVGLVFALIAGSGRAETLEQEILARLDQIRAVRSDGDAKTIERFNEQMDATWQFFTANQAQALPILRAQLGAELGQASPSDLLLLDVGFFLYTEDAPEGKAVALNALLRLNPRAPVIAANNEELFEFAHAVAEDHDARVLPFIERAFLSSDSPVYIPQHALKLDGTLICVFLYGAYGAESEGVLRTKLADKAVAKRVLEILVWLGSPVALPEVRQALADSPDFATFSRVASYMMRSAGPAGRNFLLALDPKPLDSQSKQYLAEIREAAQGVSFEAAKAGFASIQGDQKLPDAEVAVRLDGMIKNNGVDDRTSPLAILSSGLSADLLISKLTTVRSRTLFRLSDEALSDVEVTNALINALRYRGAVSQGAGSH